MSERDPMTQTFDGLWKLLENNQMFCGLVKAGSRVKYSNTKARQPAKAEVLSADFPEVKIIPVSGVYNLFATSNHTHFTKRFQIQVGTGDMRTDEMLFPLEIAIISAFTHWSEVMLPMTWKGHNFFTKLQMADAPEGQRQSDIQRGIAGWSVLMSTSADLYILTSDLQGVL